MDIRTSPISTTRSGSSPLQLGASSRKFINRDVTPPSFLTVDPNSSP